MMCRPWHSPAQSRTDSGTRPVFPPTQTPQLSSKAVPPHTPLQSWTQSLATLASQTPHSSRALAPKQTPAQSLSDSASWALLPPEQTPQLSSRALAGGGCAAGAKQTPAQSSSALRPAQTPQSSTTALPKHTPAQSLSESATWPEPGPEHTPQSSCSAFQKRPVPPPVQVPQLSSFAACK